MNEQIKFWKSWKALKLQDFFQVCWGARVNFFFFFEGGFQNFGNPLSSALWAQHLQTTPTSNKDWLGRLGEGVRAGGIFIWVGGSVWGLLPEYLGGGGRGGIWVWVCRCSLACTTARTQ